MYIGDYFAAFMFSKSVIVSHSALIRGWQQVRLSLVSLFNTVVQEKDVKETSI